MRSWRRAKYTACRCRRRGPRCRSRRRACARDRRLRSSFRSRSRSGIRAACTSIHLGPGSDIRRRTLIAMVPPVAIATAGLRPLDPRRVRRARAETRSCTSPRRASRSRGRARDARGRRPGGRAPPGPRSRATGEDAADRALAPAARARRRDGRQPEGAGRARGAERRQGDLVGEGGAQPGVENFRFYASRDRLDRAAARTRSAARSSSTR